MGGYPSYAAVARRTNCCITREGTTDEEHGTAERKALYLVAATFFLLAAYITYEAVGALISGEGPESSTVALVLSIVHPHHADPRLPQGAHGKGDGQQGARGRLGGDVGMRLPLGRAAGRRGSQRRFRVVVGRPRGGTRYASGDPLAGVGDPGGGAGGTRGGGVAK
jgi:hypothetical protein